MEVHLFLPANLVLLVFIHYKLHPQNASPAQLDFAVHLFRKHQYYVLLGATHLGMPQRVVRAQLARTAHPLEDPRSFVCKGHILFQTGLTVWCVLPDSTATTQHNQAEFALLARTAEGTQPLVKHALPVPIRQ